MKNLKSLTLIFVLCLFSAFMLCACSERIRIEGLSFEGASYVYDGTPKTISVTGLPQGASLVYDTATTYTDAGIYPVAATITTQTGDKIVLKATLTITKAKYDMSGISFDSQAFIYDGNSKSIEIEGNLPEGVTVSYENNEKADAGSYTAIAKFTSTDKNYEEIPNMVATLAISKATYDLSGITFKSQAFIYDGGYKGLEIEGTLPEGVTVSYEGNNKNSLGSHIVTAKFTSNNKNYEKIPDMSASYVIYDADGLPFYEVIFDSNGGSQVEKQTVLHGSYISVPDAPTRGEDIFVGWYIDENNEWSFNSRVVDRNITLIAKWKAPYNYYKNESSGITIKGYYGTKTDIVFPDTIDGITVTEIDSLSVPENTTSITLPNTVKTIKTKAFANIKSLKTLIIPYGVEVIEANAFGFSSYSGATSCSSLESIEIPESVKTIGENAFYGCTALKSIKFPSSLEEISANILNGCTSLTSVEISNGTVSIGDYAFYNCEKLKTLIIPDTVTSLGSNVFYGCNSLEYKTVDKIRYLGSSTNPYLVLVQIVDTAASSVTIQNGTRFISAGAFENAKITSISIPDSVTSIGKYAFRNCHELTSANIPKNLTKLETGIFYGTSLKSITIPNGVTEIGVNAFHATNITQIFIPDSVLVIGEDAFSNSDLKSVTFGANCQIEVIPEHAFYFCDLTSFFVPASVKRIEGWVFSGNDITTVIFAPNTQIEFVDGYAFSVTEVNTVYFGGDAEKWIDSNIEDTALLNATRYYYSATKPTESGNYWYYDEKTGMPVIW